MEGGGATACDIKQLLTQTRVDALLAQRRPLVFLPSNGTVGDVLQLLSQHGLLSAPVFAADADGSAQPALPRLLGFASVWDVLCLFLSACPASPGGITAEQLEAQGAALCARPLLSLFESQPGFKAPGATALDGGASEPRSACADWEIAEPTASLLEVIRNAFLPRPPAGGSGLQSWGSGMGFVAALQSPRVSASTPGAAPAAGAGNSGGGGGSGSGGTCPSPRTTPPPQGPGHARHPAASHRVVVSLPGGSLAVLSQSDILRFLAANHQSLRPLGKASLAELGLATGSLHLAAGPPPAAGGAGGSGGRPPPLCPGSPFSGGANSHANNSSGGWVGTPPGQGVHLPAVPSSPKPPLGGSLGSGGGGSVLGSFMPGGSSPMADSHMPSAGAYVGGCLSLSRGGSGSLGAAGAPSGPVGMQMSPPASPRVSGGHLLSRGGSLGGAPGGHRAAARRQLVAVHESVPVLEALRVLLQQRVSAVAVLAGTGPSPNMRLVGNLSASDLRHLRPGGFGQLALSVKAFLASKPLAPDQAIAVNPPPAAASAAAPGAAPPRPVLIMAHAPTCFTCQATASLDELVRMLGGRSAGIHRVYVVDPDQRPAGVVTTTDVLQLLSSACSRE